MRRILLAMVAFAAGSAGAVYKCVDERGITLVGDVPPAGCANVVLYEVSRSGKVLRKIDPTPTPEQEKRMREEQEKQKAAERAAAEQKRRDLALLNTYASEREFDVARDRNIEPIKVRIASAKERLDAVDKQQRRIQNELEFHKEAASAKARKVDAPPTSLLAELERGKKEKESLEAAIVQYEKEIVEVKARYEADKKRWVEVKAGASTPAPAPASASAKAPEPRAVRKN